ncbi:Uncharacterised protein [uncultured archaeon]|nr:Uncharacterised protein [uncultured archaeon]
MPNGVIWSSKLAAEQPKTAIISEKVERPKLKYLANSDNVNDVLARYMSYSAEYIKDAMKKDPDVSSGKESKENILAAETVIRDLETGAEKLHQGVTTEKVNGDQRTYLEVLTSLNEYISYFNPNSTGADGLMRTLKRFPPMFIKSDTLSRVVKEGLGGAAAYVPDSNIILVSSSLGNSPMAIIHETHHYLSNLGNQFRWGGLEEGFANYFTMKLCKENPRLSPLYKKWLKTEDGKTFSGMVNGRGVYRIETIAVSEYSRLLGEKEMWRIYLSGDDSKLKAAIGKVSKTALEDYEKAGSYYRKNDYMYEHQFGAHLEKLIDAMIKKRMLPRDYKPYEWYNRYMLSN